MYLFINGSNVTVPLGPISYYGGNAPRNRVRNYNSGASLNARDGPGASGDSLVQSVAICKMFKMFHKNGKDPCGLTTRAQSAIDLEQTGSKLKNREHIGSLPQCPGSTVMALGHSLVMPWGGLAVPLTNLYEILSSRCTRPYSILITLKPALNQPSKV